MNDPGRRSFSEIYLALMPYLFIYLFFKNTPHILNKEVHKITDMKKIEPQQQPDTKLTITIKEKKNAK